VAWFLGLRPIHRSPASNCAVRISEEFVRDAADLDKATAQPFIGRVVNVAAVNLSRLVIKQRCHMGSLPFAPLGAW
jgi:hypothetical protein